MLADINLLPKKPPKNVANHITILITLLGVTGGLTYFHGKSTYIQHETENLVFQKRIAETEATRIERELEMLEAANSDVVAQQNIIDALNQTIYTTQVMAEVQNHLPDNAKIVSYTYLTGDMLTFRILVDESREVGNFVERISTVPWVDNARVDSVTLDNTTGTKFLGSVTITLNRETLTSWEWGGQ